MAKDKESGSPMKGTAMEFPVSFGKVTYAPGYAKECTAITARGGTGFRVEDSRPR
jgi:hypothetical protein